MLKKFHQNYLKVVHVTARDDIPQKVIKQHRNAFLMLRRNTVQDLWNLYYRYIITHCSFRFAQKSQLHGGMYSCIQSQNRIWKLFLPLLTFHHSTSFCNAHYGFFLHYSWFPMLHVNSYSILIILKGSKPSFWIFIPYSYFYLRLKLAWVDISWEVSASATQHCMLIVNI